MHMMLMLLLTVFFKKRYQRLKYMGFYNTVMQMGAYCFHLQKSCQEMVASNFNHFCFLLFQNSDAALRVLHSSEHLEW